MSDNKSPQFPWILRILDVLNDDVWKITILASKMLSCSLEVNEFEPHSGYCVHFWNNTFGKCMNPNILQVYVK